MESQTEDTERPVGIGKHDIPPSKSQNALGSNHTKQAENGDDVDRCRICRGEGSKEEELFYPCKCNGSIRYVHQSCLVEWLSHSQKKHCELCKTSYRFTKLYDANMPQSVPMPVFLRQAALHAWKRFLNYTRLHLVAFVWVFWLPWCMRAVWRGLFWLGDGGWVDWRRKELQAAGIDVRKGAASSPWSRASSNLAFGPGALASMVMSGFSNGIKKQGNLVPDTNQTHVQEPITFSIVKWLYRHMVGKTEVPEASPASGAYPTGAPQLTHRPPSWLSDVHVLKSLTRSSIVNNIIIDTLEGQLITMLIVVTFIVLFLIREWVMQQQQNMLFGPEALQRLDAHREGQVQGEDQAAAESGAQPDRNAEEGAHDTNQAARILLQPRGRLQRRATHSDGQQSQHVQDGESIGEGMSTSVDAMSVTTPASTPNNSKLDAISSGTSPARPSMPERGATGAFEIRRTLDEDTNLSADEKDAGVQVFKDLWSRAQHRPSAVLKIIEEENRVEELDWIVKFMKKLEGTLSQPTPPSHDRDSNSEESNLGLSSGHLPGINTPEQIDRPNTAERERRLDVMLSSEAPALFPPSNPFDHPETWHLKGAELIDMPIDGDSRPSSQQEPNPVLALPPPKSVPSNDVLDSHQENQVVPVSPLAIEPSQARDTDGIGPRMVEPMLAPPLRNEPLFNRLLDLMWGPSETASSDHGTGPGEDDEHVVQNIAEEAPFVPAHRPQILPAEDAVPAVAEAQQQDAGAAVEPADAAAAAGDALDDLEDIEGVMELIGMQGPMLNLIQNGMFCALLVALTIVVAVWLPYIVGKLYIIALAHPLQMLQQPLRCVSAVADMIVDLCIFAAGCSYYWIDQVCNWLCSPVGMVFPSLSGFFQDTLLAETAKGFAESAFDRLTRASLVNGEMIAPYLDMPRISAIALESLRRLNHQAIHIIVFALRVLEHTIGHVQFAWEHNTLLDLFGMIWTSLKGGLGRIHGEVSKLLSLAPALLNVNPLKISISTRSQRISIDYRQAVWGSKDRAIAIIFGYLFFALLGMVYLRVTASLKGTNKKGRVDGWLADILYQAGGVMKVILIISIEMIVFPLYCGLLLDVALLPLFADATILSRIRFAITSPHTALFIHWFIGTCYMFHFSLFVSMCRKVLRSGVLFFIRDPDDPTFHPVRDVLERNIATQLWKISFSAMVYGALIIVCLGGIVWSLSATAIGLFPVVWTSNEPVLEFPIDLLFYNFLLPLAVKYCRPANGLTKIYSWWLHKCASWLRLSDFLFGEDRSDEKTWQAERTWQDRLLGAKAELTEADKEHDSSDDVGEHEQEVVLKTHGKKVRAPASDQLRIPKGHPTLFEVNDEDEPINMSEKSKTFLQQNIDSFKVVYVPPRFRLRIGCLITLVWLFAAVTGLSVTALPLLLGRFLLYKTTSGKLQFNDIYALSVGLCLLGGVLYAALNISGLKESLDAKISPHQSSIAAIGQRAKELSKRTLGLIYTYSAFLIFLPALVSLVMECYLIVPLHTFITTHTEDIESSLEPLGGESLPISPDPSSTSLFSRPIVHLIQDWTLGILYIKVVGRLILWSAPSRPATALRRIVRNGWLSPDVWLATTGFIFPSTILMAILLTFPLALSWLAAHSVFSSAARNDDFFRACIYRYSYPAVLAAALTGTVIWLLIEAFSRWRRKIRDEVYLIGERLHNYGDTKRKKEGKGKEKEIVERPILEEGTSTT